MMNPVTWEVQIHAGPAGVALRQQTRKRLLHADPQKGRIAHTDVLEQTRDIYCKKSV